MTYESGLTNEANMVVGDDPMEEIRELKAAFQKQATRMENLESQVETLTEEVKHLKGIPGGDPGDTSDVDPDKDPRDVLAVTKHRLDNGDSCPLEASIWDAVLFVGHPAIGAVVSGVTVFMWAVNIAIQVWFCYLVWVNMLEADVTAETLDLLLRFRIFAHSVDFADGISERSMIYLYCSEEVPGKLHESAAQATLYNLIAKFKPADALGGRSLMCLAQLIWLTFILQEVNLTFDFARSLSHIGVGKRTRVIMTETDAMLASGESSRQLAGDSNQASQRPDLVRTPTGSIARDVPHRIVCRLCSITWIRYLLSFAFIVVPRLAVASMMGIVGVYFLGKTANMEDLVLNAIALNFILDIDNILYSVFAPKRLKTLMNNIEPFPMPHKHRRNTAGLHTILKMSLVVGLMGLVYWFIDWPFLWRMSMADEILCGGNTDFVWAMNGASGMVHVTRSNSESSATWTLEEEVILQVVAPNLTHTSYYEEPYWQDYSNFDQNTIDIATSSSGRAIWESDVDADSYDEAEYETLHFNKLVDLQVLTTGDAAKELSCADLSSGQVHNDGTSSVDAALAYLKAELDNDTVTSCADVPWQECSKLEKNRLRALCPVHCGCDKPARYYLGFAGLFHSPHGGCPSQCDILASARNELLYSLSHFDESSDNWQRFEECDVINGTGLSASYPCNCGNTTCPPNWICTESTSSCFEAPSTTLLSGAQNGSNTLRVSSTEGFHEGGRVVIAGGGKSETGTIASFGSIILVEPLEHSYPANSTVVEEWAPENASEAPSPTPAPTRQELSGPTQSTAEDGGPPTHPPTAESTPEPPGSTPAPTDSAQPPTAESTPAPTESSSPESTPGPTNGGPTPTAAPTAQPTPAPTGSSPTEEPTPRPPGSGGPPPQTGAPPSTTPEDRRLEGRQLSAPDSEQEAVGGMYGCVDVPAHRLIFDADDGCVDLDEATLSTDKNSRSCHTTTCSRDYDDSDFTAAFMCCHCSSDGVQGGVTENLSTSYRCLDELTDNCQNMHLPSFWYLSFVRGLNEYIQSSTEHKHLVRNILYGSGVELIPQLTDTQKEDLISWVTNGSLQYSLMDGEWRIMPGIPHPRGLGGCEYLASFEVKSLLGIDICNDEPFSSLRLLCPETCGCRGKVYDVEHGERQTYTYTDQEPYLFAYSQKRTDLRYCPASCVLAHPTVSGSDTYTEYQPGSGVGPKGR